QSCTKYHETSGGGIQVLSLRFRSLLGLRFCLGARFVTSDRLPLVYAEQGPAGRKDLALADWPDRHGRRPDPSRARRLRWAIVALGIVGFVAFYELATRFVGIFLGL